MVKMKKELTFLIIVLLISTSFLPLSFANAFKTSINTTKTDDTHKISYDMIVITPDKWEKILEPLVEHKNTYNIKTKLVTLEEIYKQIFWRGRDNAEKIKYFIKDAKENWNISYVLLVGGMKNQGPEWNLPVRYSYTNDGYKDAKFLSDLYFADIYDENGNFSTWDEDNDGIFGEWNGEEAEDKNIDLYPDVSIGRLPCRNTQELKNMVKKIIKYETESCGEEWSNRIMVASGDTYPHNYDWADPNWTDYEGEELSKEILENMSTYEHIKLWVSSGTLKSPIDTIKAFNKGVGFVCILAHGTPLSLKLYNTEKNKTIGVLSLNTMKFLKNKNKLPICVLGSCHVLEFDVNIFNFFKEFKKHGLNYFINFSGKKPALGHFFRYDFVRECIGWKLTCKNNGGSIATLGFTNFGLTKEDKKETFEGGLDYLIPCFFRQIGVKKVEYLGEAWVNSINDYLEKYKINWSTPSGGDSSMDAKTVEEWIIFGDPSLKIGGYDVN